MRARLRSWWQQIQQHWIAIGVIAIVLVVIIALIITGYQLNWTGFSGGESKTTTISTPQGTYRATEVQLAKNFWDWLNLLGVLAIPVVAGLGVAWFTHVQQRRDQQFADQRAESERKDIVERAKLELEIALDNQREEALQEYINRMSELLEKQLRTSPLEEDMRIVARARTLNVLRRLNSERKGNVIQFLYESHLLGTRIIDLSYTQLSEANLYRARLCNANLFRAGLFRANLFQADLSLANLSETYLVEADLRGAKLCNANLSGANLHKADLRGADLRAEEWHKVKLQEALYNKKKILMKDPQGEGLLSLEPTQFPDGFNCEGEGMAYVDCYPYDKPEVCQVNVDQSSTPDTERLIDLSYIDLSYIDLSYKKLPKAILYQAKLIQAKLLHANLTFANLSGADLSGADLSGADLSKANLTSAKATPEQMKKAKSLEGATMPDGSKHQRKALAPIHKDVIMSNTRFKILMVSTEAVPFVKEGGVADVMGSLPKELSASGHQVALFLPRYGSIDTNRWSLTHTGLTKMIPMSGRNHFVSVWQTSLPDSPVTVYLLDNEEFFGRHQQIYLGLDQRDEQRRFLLFCRGLLEALPELGFVPDIFHLNDWQTAPCAAYLRTIHRYLLRRGMARIVYSIHNLQYQGRWDPSILDEAGLDSAEVFTPRGLEFCGDVNWMKAGIMYADVVTTVSHRYAEEIQTLDYGWGLDEVLFQRHSRIFGIPNGLDWDAWNPASDSNLTVRYTTAEALKAKAANRTSLRKEFGLPDDPDVPLVGIVSRLVDQKGFDLIADIASELRKLPLQLVVLGTGQAYYEQLFQELAASSDNVRARIDFDVALSHRIYASADFFLMPSTFEPGGLGQLIALRYGALPIVHATGGLADTVTDLFTDPINGNGISFTHYTSSALLDALQRSLRLYAEHDRWPDLIARAMAYDSHWSSSARAYSQLYERVLRLPPI